MGLPKKMKLGANKVRGANYRLMLTVWSGEGKESGSISLPPHPYLEIYIYIHIVISLILSNKI